MRRRTSEIDPAEWQKTINQCLHGQRKFSSEQRECFAATLLEQAPRSIEWGNLLFASNADVKIIKKQVRRLVSTLDMLKNLRERVPPLQTIEEIAGGQCKIETGYQLDVALVSVFAKLLQARIEGVYEATSKPGRDNRQALGLSYMVCQYYDKFFEKMPTVTDSDIYRASGDPNDGTPYERVCRAVGELSGIKISWSTQRQALANYKRDKPIFQGVIELMKSNQK